MKRKARLAQEFGVYSEDMPVIDFMYLSDYVLQVWENKRKAIESGQVYVGGG